MEEIMKKKTFEHHSRAHNDRGTDPDVGDPGIGGTD